MSIIKAITKLGVSLGTKITADGIENETQIRFSRTEGGSRLPDYVIS